MGLFSRKPTAPAPEGNGDAPVTATFARGDDLEVEVAGITHHWDAARALAGKRPREEDEIEREKSVKVRLVREPGNQYDSNAIAVWSDKHGHVGYVPKEIAADFGPVIDELRVLGAKELDGEAMDFYCSADLYAEWDYWDPDDDDHDPDVDKNEPERIDLTLWFKLPLNPKVTRRG
jgi:hypothetical protein